MSGESAPKPKPRLVLCPKCWQLLPESPDYDVYKCGGCGTTLQAKKRRSKAVNSESSAHETYVAPGNALEPKADDKQYNSGEKLVSCEENGTRKKLTSSSSGESSLDGHDTRGQIGNGECNGEQIVASLENGFNDKETSSSSGECLNENGGRDQIEDGEGNGEQVVTSQENSFGEKASSSSSGECSVIGNGGRNQIEDSEYNGEQPVISQENDLRTKACGSSLRECSLDGNDGTDQIENGECKGEQVGQFNLPDEELENETDIHKLSDLRRHTVSNNDCSDEITHFEIEASAELMAERLAENAKNTNLRLEGEELSNGNVPVEGAGEKLIIALDKEDINDEKSNPVTGNDLEAIEELNNGKLLLEGAEQELSSESDREEVNDEKSALAGAKPKVDINGSNEAGSEELNNENVLLEATEEELNVCALEGEDLKHKQSEPMVVESEVNNTGNASSTKRLSTDEGSISCAYPFELGKATFGNHASSKTIDRSYDRVRSVDSLDSTEVINHGFETSGTLGGLSKSSTTRSYHHAYDGSVSSNDGVDEQFPNQYLDTYENTYTVANGVSEGGSRKGKGVVNSMLRGDLETQHQSYFCEEKPRVPRDSRRSVNEMPETTRHGHAHWIRTKRDEFPPRIPHHPSGSQSGYESGSTSNQMHDEFHCSSSYLSPDSFDDPDQEKMKLLRMVYKLQNQLNKTNYLTGETNERRFYRGLDYPSCDGICSHGTNWCQKHNFSHVPYLNDPTSSIHHVDHSCLPCCPQQWQRSRELPPRDLYQYEEFCRPSPVHSCCLSHHSYPSSPQCFVTSNFPAHGHEARSCDQMHRPEVKKYFREKPNLTRRHCRPVAGGAPFVTCHKCLKLLQLPADFLLFKRVYHKLRCGSCQEVLKFSMQNRSHVVSYAPNDLEPLSSYHDNQNKVIDGSNPPSESHINYHHSPHADHGSYSDDYGHSLGKSYNSERDPVSVTSLDPLHASAYEKPKVSSGTLEPIIEKDKTASRGPLETDELAVNSSNVSSELESDSQPKSSLHQLMGYSSPSQLIRGIP